MSDLLEKYIVHSGDEAQEFLTDYFSSSNVFLVGAAGFDPRATDIVRTLVSTGARVRAEYIKEIRPSPPKALEKMAEENIAEVGRILGYSPSVNRIQIFADDGAAIGGGKVIEAASAWILNEVTDVIVDVSAMSNGVFFPLIRYLKERIISEGLGLSLHVLVSNNPRMDYKIRATYDDKARYMHGYDGKAKLMGRSDPIRLWLPHLVPDRSEVFERLHNFINPSDVCPVVPFLGSNPRRAEELIFEYKEALIDEWETDLHNVVLAAEDDPLDIYRTIIRIHRVRRQLFTELSATMTVISPMGNKLASVGAMLAAMDETLPVAYVESASYAEELADQIGPDPQSSLVHVWVHRSTTQCPQP